MSATVRAKKTAKRPYLAPSLTIYGSAMKLTAGGTGQADEGAGNDPTKHP